MDKGLKYLLLMLLLILGCSTEPELEPEDCAGVAGGNSYLDECGGCDANVNNDCIQDCADVWGGTAVEDDCGVCSGDGSSCVLLWGVYYNIETTTYLNLSSNQLTGEFPSSIGNLTNLQYLSLSGNQLTGEIPQEVCDLIESNNWESGWSFEDDILDGNNLINTCD